jgi:DNA processing protein
VITVAVHITSYDKFMYAKDKVWWSWWCSIEGVGWRHFQQLRQWQRTTQKSWSELALTYPEWTAQLGWSSQLLEQILAFGEKFPIHIWEEFLASQEVSLCCYDEACYPDLLKEMDGAPWLLYLQGPTTLLQARLPISVVGTRRVTGYGKLVTQQLVKELVAEGATIISGGMYGVDLLAHQAALESGGKTVVVLGFGHQHWYPASYRDWKKRLLDQDALLVSEYSPMTPARKGTFVQRNRIVAGLSKALIVTEAAAGSGTMTTVQFALNAGREVMAVPGSITNPYSEGTRYLLKEGATLVASAADVLQELGISRQDIRGAQSGTSSAIQLNSSCAAVLQTIQQHQPISLEALVAQLQQPPAVVMASLTELELSDRVEYAAGRWSAVARS